MLNTIREIATALAPYVEYDVEVDKQERVFVLRPDSPTFKHSIRDCQFAIVYPHSARFYFGKDFSLEIRRDTYGVSDLMSASLNGSLDDTQVAYALARFDNDHDGMLGHLLGVGKNPSDAGKLALYCAAVKAGQGRIYS
jgi:hypothetical protein